MLQHKIFTSLIGNWKWIFRHILKLPHVEGALFRRWKWAFGLPSHCILVDFGRGGSGIKHVGSASTDFYHHRPHSNPSPLPYHHTRSDQAGVKWANFFNHLSALKHFPRFSFQDRLLWIKKWWSIELCVPYLSLNLLNVIGASDPKYNCNERIMCILIQNGKGDEVINLCKCILICLSANSFSANKCNAKWSKPEENHKKDKDTALLFLCLLEVQVPTSYFRLFLTQR